MRAKNVLAKLFCVASIHQDIHMLFGWNHMAFSLLIAQIAPYRTMIYENDECLCHICNQIIPLELQPVRWIIYMFWHASFSTQHLNRLYSTMKCVFSLWKLIINLRILFTLHIEWCGIFHSKVRHQFCCCWEKSMSFDQIALVHHITSNSTWYIARNCVTCTIIVFLFVNSNFLFPWKWQVSSSDSFIFMDIKLSLCVYAEWIT